MYGEKLSGNNCHIFSRKSVPCVHKCILQINTVSRSKILGFSTTQLRTPTSVTSCLCGTLWLGEELNSCHKQRYGFVYSLSVRLTESIWPNLAPEELDSSFCERFVVLSASIMTVQFLWPFALRRQSSPLALLDTGVPSKFRHLFIFRYGITSQKAWCFGLFFFNSTFQPFIESGLAFLFFRYTYKSTAKCST
jgi:hypothetical protein